MEAGAAHAAAAIANATKASGVIVRVSPGDFQKIVERTEAALVIVAQGGVFKKHFRYLTSYKGLAFFAQTPTALVLPRRVELVAAEKIWVPD